MGGILLRRRGLDFDEPEEGNTCCSGLCDAVGVGRDVTSAGRTADIPSAPIYWKHLDYSISNLDRPNQDAIKSLWLNAGTK